MSGIADWVNELDQLLAEARDASASNDEASRRSVSRKLTDFVVRTPRGGPDERAGMKQIDRIAAEAAIGLLMQSIQERVANIASRTSDFVSLRKDLEGQAETNEATAAVLRLDRVKKVVDTSTELVREMKDLANTYREADEEDLAKKLEGVVTRIQNLRSEIETTR